MVSKRKANEVRKLVRSRRGDIVVVLMGFTRDTLEWLKGKLDRDTSQKSARFVGVPSTPHDWRLLYRQATVAEAIQIVWQEIELQAPYRLIVLYVPSRDDRMLIDSPGMVCYLGPLVPEVNQWASYGGSISWRHNKDIVFDAVNAAMLKARRATNALKAEITDKRISAFSLPARNFYYPDRHSTICGTYLELAEGTVGFKSLRDTLRPLRFNRDQLPGKAFKGKQHTALFFRDLRNRVFPPDPYHGQSRTHSVKAPHDEFPWAVRQRYRFGVIVRDGRLHFDLQYELPRKLHREPMYCAEKGEIKVSGTHANVGVNDFVWVPGGKKETK